MIGRCRHNAKRMPRAPVVAFFLALLVRPAICTQADTLSASWQGTWVKNGDSLPVVVTFQRTSKGYIGSFDSDVLQVAKIPFKEVEVQGARVHFVLVGDATTTIFEGTLKGRTLRGTFRERDTSGHFRLVRASRETSEIQSRDVEFENVAVKLRGSLLLPNGRGRHPAILFLHGSGAEGRFASRYLAQRFASAGFVALSFDKRGAGQSTGDWKTSGFEDLAGDAVSGIRFLQTQPEVDSRRVGVYGHSQGATLAPLVANRAGDLAFIIASAAGGIDMAEMEEYSVGNSIGVPSLSPQEAADAKSFVRAIVNVGYRGAPRMELDRLAAKFKGRPWYFDPPPPDNFYWSFARRIARYDPAEQWSRVRCPALLMFAANDQRVPTVLSSNSIVARLRAAGNIDVTLKIFPDADHTFRIPSPKGGWPKRVNGYADDMIRWAIERLKKWRI